MEELNLPRHNVWKNPLVILALLVLAGAIIFAVIGYYKRTQGISVEEQVSILETLERNPNVTVEDQMRILSELERGEATRDQQIQILNKLDTNREK